MTAIEAHLRSDRRSKAQAFGAAAVVCLALLALLAVVQVAHLHSNESDAAHCPLCVVMHTAAPVPVTAAVVVLVTFGPPVAIIETRAVVRHRHPKLFTRPPPFAC